MNRKEGRKEGRKNKYIVAIILAMLILPSTYIKCQAQDVGVLLAPIVNSAVKYYGNKLIDKAFSKSMDPIKVGKHEIHLSEDCTYQGNPGYLLGAYNENNQQVSGLCYAKNDKEHIKNLDNFLAMKNPEEKKAYLQETFLKIVKFDLGYVPEPIKTVETPPEKETASATPTASPAETAAAPTN